MSRRWLFFRLFQAFIVLTTMPAGATQVGAPPVQGALSIEGKQVPLPEGAWVAAGRASTAGVVSVALLRLRGDAVTGGMLVQASRLGTAAAWGTARGCARTDLPLARIRYQSDHDGSCAYVARVENALTGDAAGDAAVDAAWGEARHTAAARGWTLPVAWAVVGVRVTTPLSAVQVRYAAPIDPTDETGMAALLAWTPGAWDQVERGLHNQARELPDWAAAGTSSPTPPPPPGGLTLSRSVWKTISYRVIGTSIDFTTNLIAIGDLATAAALSALPIVIGPWIYLGHEMAWEYFGAPTAPHLTLPGLGAESAWSPPAVTAPGQTL